MESQPKGESAGAMEASEQGRVRSPVWLPGAGPGSEGEGGKAEGGAGGREAGEDAPPPERGLLLALYEPVLCPEP